MVSREKNILPTAQSQYEKCMTNEEFYESHHKGRITKEQSAMLQCKQQACLLQLCMTKPQSFKSQSNKRDVLTGEIIMDPASYSCNKQYQDYQNCIDSVMKGTSS